MTPSLAADMLGLDRTARRRITRQDENRRTTVQAIRFWVAARR